jgi:predicted lipoprotein
VKRPGRSLITRATLGAAWLALAAGTACSRTDDPLEHFASGSSPSGAGTSPGPGGSGSGVAGASNPGGKSGAGQTTTGGSSGGTGASEHGGAAEGGADTGPDWPADFGCGDAPVSSEPFTQAALRGAAADCAVWHYCRFEGAATQLDYELSGYAEEPSPAKLARARSSYAQAMSMWSVVEPFRIGPGAPSSDDQYHGKGLSSLIYVWPEVDRCRVEDQVAMQGYLSNLDGVFTSGRGLFALDYLLHYPGSDTACPASRTSAKKWATLDEDEIGARKRQYAAALGADLVARTGALRNVWAADGGNFRQTLLELGGYPNQDGAMTILAWSLLYIELEVKDYKLGVPLGLTATAPVTTPESAYSGLLTENVRANLRGFRALFQGCGPEGEGLGFDDWLTEAGHAALAQDIVTAWQGAQAAADQYPRFDQASTAQLQALHAAVKALTDLLKTELFGEGSVLSLDLPAGIGDDTD